MRRAASAAPSACCSSAASTQSPKACRPFSGAAGPVIATTAVPSSAAILTRSEMRPSSVLNSSSGTSLRITAGINGAYRAAPSLGLRAASRLRLAHDLRIAPRKFSGTIPPVRANRTFSNFYSNYITWGGWGSNPRPADYEKYGPALRALYRHGYHGVVPLVALTV